MADCLWGHECFDAQVTLGDAIKETDHTASAQLRKVKLAYRCSAQIERHRGSFSNLGCLEEMGLGDARAHCRLRNQTKP